MRQTYRMMRLWGGGRIEAVRLARTLGRKLRRNDPPQRYDTWSRPLSPTPPPTQKDGDPPSPIPGYVGGEPKSHPFRADKRRRYIHAVDPDLLKLLGIDEADLVANRAGQMGVHQQAAQRVQVRRLEIGTWGGAAVFGLFTLLLVVQDGPWPVPLGTGVMWVITFFLLGRSAQRQTNDAVRALNGPVHVRRTENAGRPELQRPPHHPMGRRRRHILPAADRRQLRRRALADGDRLGERPGLRARWSEDPEGRRDRAGTRVTTACGGPAPDGSSAGRQAPGGRYRGPKR